MVLLLATPIRPLLTVIHNFEEELIMFITSIGALANINAVSV